CGVWYFSFFHDPAIRIENANLMHFGAPIDTYKKMIGDFGQSVVPPLLNLACRNQRRPYTGALGANSPRDFRLRPNREGAAPHQALTCGGERDGAPPGPANSIRLPALGSHSEGYRGKAAALVPASALKRPEREALQFEFTLRNGVIWLLALKNASGSYEA